MPDGSRLKAGQGGFRDNFTSLFNKSLVKTVCSACVCVPSYCLLRCRSVAR